MSSTITPVSVLKSNSLEEKSLTSISQELSNKMYQQQLTSELCKRYDVTSVVRDYNISSARKAELFLLGATFSTESIRGMEYEVMIIHKVMYLLKLCEFRYV